MRLESRIDRETEKMVGGNNPDEKEYIRHPVDASPLLGPE